MKLMNVLLKITAIVVVICTFMSCDDEFNSVGNEIIGSVNFEDGQYNTTPIAFSKKFERVQTNSLVAGSNNNITTFHSNVLGVYDDPIYGQSTYSILSQVQPSQFNPSFGDNAVLDSVVFNIPYFSTVTGTEKVEVILEDDSKVTETETLYRLDSIYQNKPFNLSIYQSNYFLRDFDPSSNLEQAYYSNDIESFGSQVEGTLLYNRKDFTPSPKQLITSVPDGSDQDTLRDRTRITPRLRLSFFDDPDIPVADDKGEEIRNRFQELFLNNEGSIELSNVDNFNNFFRGIYFKAEPEEGTGNLLYLNLRGGNITLYYKNDGSLDAEDQTQRTQRELVLSFTGTIINSIKTELDPIIAEELKPENQDNVNGEDNLYLKGGDGSFAVIDLFSRYVEVDENGEFMLDENDGPIFIDNPTEAQKDKTEFDFVKSRNWLINNASFKFYINQDQVTSGDTEPERIYIFNLETGVVLADYNLDVNFRLFDENNPINSILNHLGRISRGSDMAGEFYEIRITQHIINLLNEDIDNIKLGLCVSQNVNFVTGVFGDTATNIDEIIPTSSIVSHEGTILFGNGTGVPEAKRIKLNISYTASKNN